MEKNYKSFRTDRYVFSENASLTFKDSGNGNAAVDFSGKAISLKSFLFVLMLLFVSIASFAQPYVRSTFASTYTPITTAGGATQIVSGTTTTTFSGTTGTASTDDAAALIALPFAFTYNSVAYTTSNFVNVCTNGYLSFVTASANTNKITTGASDNFFSTTAPNITIAGWFDDLDVALGSGKVLYQTQGSVGSRSFTVQYENVRTYYQTATSTINFQIILYEGTNVVELKYGTATNAIHNTSESAVAGLEWGTGGNGNYIDAFTGSKVLGTTLNNSENFPSSTIGYRFTPGTPVAIPAGTYNVGTGQTYPTLSEAIADVNHRGVSGAVTFNCTDASYPTSAGNLYPMLVSTIAGSSAGNTVTINGNGAVLSYRGVYAGTINTSGSTVSTSLLPTIGLMGSDYVTLRNFTTNLSATAPATTPFGVAVSRGVLVSNITATDGATNNTVRDMTVALDRTNTSTIGIQQTTNITATNATGANSTNKYYNLNISNVYSGVYLLGTSGFPDLSCDVGIISGGITTIGGAGANDIGNGSSTTWGIRASNQSGSKIFNTEVRNVSVTSTVLSDGIFVENFAGNNEVYNNSIHDIKNLSTSATTGVTGIRFTYNTTGTNNLKVYNNFVYGISSGYTGTASATRQVRGIYSSGTGGSTSQSMNVDFNSVRLDLSANPNISSACWEIATSTPVYTARNNVFANVTGAQTGVAKHYAVVTTSASSIGGTGSVWNRNVLYIANATNGFTALNTGTPTDYATLANWQAHTAAPDANSFSQNPQFVSATNLKINTAVATPVESNGSFFAGAITWAGLDKEGDTRNATTPDIGADEGTFTPLISNDLQATAFITPTNGASIPTGSTVTPQASFTNNGLNTQTSVTVRYRIVDPSSVEVYNQTATIPSIASGATVIVTFPASSALTAAGTYTIFAKAELGTDTVPANDQISGTLILVAPLAGDYLVGTAQPAPYNTLPSAVAALNGAGISAATRFLLTDASYDLGTTPLQINSITGSSSTNTFTIKPNTGVTSTITANVATASIIVNAADYIVLNGSNGVTVNTVCPASSASRDLTISNTNTGTSSAVVWLQTSGADGATNNIVRNCNLAGSGVTQTLIGVGSGSNSISLTSLGTGNNSNTFENNNISGAQYGIYSQGASATAKNTGTKINQNVFTASANARGGILTGFEDGIVISGNSISNILYTSSTDVFGITAGLTAISSTTSAGNEVTNAVITNNVIGSVANSGTYSAAGIAVAAAASGTTLIANNMISGVASNGTSGDFCAGIILGGGTGSVTNVYQNTVAMQGTIPGASAATQTSACLAVTNSTAPTLNIKNNIFTNTQIGNTSATLRFAAIALGYSTYTTLTTNNNDLYVAGAGPGTYTIGITGTVVAGTNSVTLANWQTTTGKEANSKNVAVVYLSSTNLHVDNTNASNVANLDGTGDTTTGITTDIDCTTRLATPDLGADEFVPPGCTDASGGTAAGSTAFCGSGTPTITASGYSTGLGSGYQWISSTVSGDYPNGGTAVSGQTNPASLTTGVVSTTTYYWLRVTCATNTSTANSNLITITINPVPAAVTVSTAGTYCGSTTLTASNGGDGTIYFQGTTSGGTSTSVPSTSQLITTSGTYYFRAQSAAGCWGAEGSATVVINPVPSTPTVTPSSPPAAICVGGTQALTANSTFAGQVNVLTQDFESGIGSWTTTNTSASTGTPALAAWTIQTNPYTYSSIAYNSNSGGFGGTKFIFSNSDASATTATGTTTNTTLESPIIATGDYTGGFTLTYRMYYKNLTSGTAEVFVEHFNGTTWTTAQSYSATQGTATGFAALTVSLPATTQKVRFRYTTTWGWYVGIDDIVLKSSPVVTYTWTASSPNAGLPAGAATASTANASIVATPTQPGSYTYTAIALGANGCTSSPATTATVTVNGLPTVDAGAPLAAICQGGTTGALGGSYSGNATGAVWSDGGAGGTFANNSGSTPATATYTAANNAASPITLTLTTTGGTCGTVNASKQLTVNSGVTYYADTDNDGYGDPAAPIVSCSGQPVNTSTNNTDCAPADGTKYQLGNFYVDADNDGYYNGDPTTTSFCYGTTAPSGYVASIIGTDCNDNDAQINPNHVEVAGNTIDDNCDGTVDETGPAVAVIPGQCGTTLSNVANTIYSQQATGAEGYRFEVTNGANVRTYDSATNSFSLASLPGGVTYATTYTIRVAVKTNGFYRTYSSSCTITTPGAAATTNVIASQCGTTLSNIANVIYANQVTSANQYRFEVTDIATSVVRTFDTAVNRFSLSDLSGGGAFGATYSIRVALRFGATWEPYGVACNVSTPATPGVTSLQASQCNITISNRWTTLYATQVPSAQGYRFRVTNGATVRFVDRAVANFALAQLTGAPLTPSTAYTVEVAVLYNSVYGAFGPACTVTTAGVITRHADAPIAIFDVKSYPNPFANTFKLDINTSSDANVGIKVYDMIGKLVESRDINVSELGTVEVGSRYSSGVYNVIVSQGENLQALRVIKR